MLKPAPPPARCDAAQVPVENLLGEENQGFKCIMHNFNHERWGFIVQANRFARVCLEDSMRVGAAHGPPTAMHATGHVAACCGLTVRAPPTPPPPFLDCHRRRCPSQYALKRKTFGKTLVEHPVIRWKLGEMARQVRALAQA